MSRCLVRPAPRCLLAFALALTLACADAGAQAFEQPRAVVAAGGGTSADASGAIRISGTFAEALTGGDALSSAGLRSVATGGFWADVRAPRDGTFRDQFEDPPAAPASRPRPTR